MAESPPEAGHVFVVHGRIEQLTHDAAIVPVDKSLVFEEYWKPLLGSSWPSAPATWSAGWGRVGDTSNWLIEVGDGDYERVLDRLALVVADAAANCWTGRRELPLIALPVLGVGGGGHDHERGKVIKKLLEALTQLAREHQVDIGLVTPDRSVYGAAQYVRRREVGGNMRPELERLVVHAREGQLALFLGAGVSIPAGLPSWNGLIAGLARETEDLNDEWLKHLGPTDQAELIQTYDKKGFAKRVRTSVKASGTRPSLVHALLAGFDVGEVVTTNYDVLYERAVRATGGRISRVLPWSLDVADGPWVLKLHGDVRHPKSIVLTRRHMVMFDAANRPSASLLQSLFLTKHVLFVGVSFTDDNLIRLVHEVEEYRERNRRKKSPDAPPFATVIDASEEADAGRAGLWRGRLDWLDSRRTMGVNSFRAQDILLDQVGMYASSDSSWLLDPRFAGMLDARDQQLAELARQLREQLPAGSETWSPLTEVLEQLGARRKS